MRHDLYGIFTLAILGSTVFVLGQGLPPKAREIIVFRNNPVFHHNSGDIYQELPRSRFLEFLNKGRIVSVKTPPDDPKLAGDVTFREPLSPWQRDEIKSTKAGGGTGEALLRCQGVAATRKALYFWRLRNDRVLWIGNGKGEGCFLRID